MDFGFLTNQINNKTTKSLNQITKSLNQINNILQIFFELVYSKNSTLNPILNFNPSVWQKKIKKQHLTYQTRSCKTLHANNQPSQNRLAASYDKSIVYKPIFCNTFNITEPDPKVVAIVIASIKVVL